MLKITIIDSIRSDISAYFSVLKSFYPDSDINNFKGSRQALEKLLAQPQDPHIILVDLPESEMRNGLLMTHLTSMFPKTKILTLKESADGSTSHGTSYTSRRSANVDTLHKPFNKSQLQAKIESYLSVFDLESGGFKDDEGSVLRPLYKSESAQTRKKA